MASITKLSVRGVRSFSPDDEEQTVEFYFPITVLVGQNGCGKTTVIESLKYAITGSFPPGNKSGQAFVHDPRSIGHSTVKAGVKLRFASKSGQQLVVARTMELTQRKNARNVTFKQLDGVLRMLDKDTGKKISQSHKCTELDKQIPGLMGISKPILDNVLFCHQEEASWPLMEGAVLKKRFDDIFDSTRYTKALDAFRKTEKELLSDIKEIKANIAGLASHKHAAEGFRRELREQEEAEEGLGDDKKELQEKLTQVEGEIERYAAIMDKTQNALWDLNDTKGKLSRNMINMNSKKSLIEKKYFETHTMEEIKEMLQDFDEKAKEIKEQESDILAKTTSIQNDIDSLHEKEMDLKSQVGRFQSKKEEHEKRVRRRLQMMEKLTQTYDVQLRFSLTQGTNASFLAAGMASQSILGGGASQDTMTTSEIGAEDMRSFLTSLDDKGAEFEERLKDHLKVSHEEQDKLSLQLQSLGGKQKAIEEERKKIKNERDRVKQELDKMPKRNPLTSRKIRPNEIEEAKSNAKKTAEKLKAANSSNRREEIQSQIRQLDTKVESIKRKLEDERRVLGSLRDSAEAQNEIAVLQEQCDRDFENLEEAVREEASAFQRFGLPPNPPLPKDDSDTGDILTKAVQSIAASVRGKYESVNDQREKEADEVNRAQRALSETAAICQEKGKSLANLRAALSSTRCLAKVKTVVGKLRSRDPDFNLDETSPEKLLEYLDNSIEEHAENIPIKIDSSTLKSLKRRIKEMCAVEIEKGDKPDEVITFKHEGRNCKLQCPCCKRDYGIGEIEDKQFYALIKQFVNEAAGSSDQETREQHQAEADQLESWRKTVYDNLTPLRDYLRITEEVKELEHEIQQLERERNRGQDSLKEKKDELDDIEREVNGLRELLDAINRAVEDANRIGTTKMRISQKRADLSFNTPNCDRDLRTVEKDMNRQMEEKDALTNKINELNKEMSHLNTAITELTNQLSQMESRAKGLEEGYAKQQEQEELKKKLESRDRELSETFAELGNELAPLQRKFKTKEQEMKQSRAHSSDMEGKMRSTLNDFLNDVKSFRGLTSAIDAWVQSDEPQQLEIITRQLSEVADRIVGRKKDLEQVTAELDQIKDMVKDQNRSKNQLEYSRDVLEFEDTIKEIEDEIASKEEAYHNIPGGDTADASHEEAMNRKNRLIEKKAQIDGRRGEVVERIRSLKRKLSSPEYKNVDREYRVELIKSETTQMAAEDLKKYQKALDEALLSYHSVKIAEVNKIIRELWLLTYKGEDINNIEIVSGQEAGARAQKSYNYRVVMTKGNTELDMRGRCSAGQRVLASIVIRLALAETFGVNCGCIALDEPTVNLDYKNKKGLAIALAQIVASRAQQRNFQLILITHDEDFVGLMKNELSSLTGFSMPDKYFEICREQAPDGKFYSKIHAKDWEDLV